MSIFGVFYLTLSVVDVTILLRTSGLVLGNGMPGSKGFLGIAGKGITFVQGVAGGFVSYVSDSLSSPDPNEIYLRAARQERMTAAMYRESAEKEKKRGDVARARLQAEKARGEVAKIRLEELKARLAAAKAGTDPETPKEAALKERADELKEVAEIAAAIPASFFLL